MFAFFRLAFAVILSLLMTVSNAISTNLIREVPEPKTAQELSEIDDLFDIHLVSREIIVVKNNNLTAEQAYSVVALQGIVGKTEAAILLNNGSSGTNTAMRELTEQGYALQYTDASGKEWTFESLLQKFVAEGCIKDMGYVLYTSQTDVDQLNTATNFATVYGWLPVPQEAEEIAIKCGLSCRKDLTGENCGFAYQLDFYNEHKDVFKDNLLIHQASSAMGLRDLAVQQNIFVMYTLEDDFIGKAFRTAVLRDMEKGTAVLGWGQYEIAFVGAMTEMGNYVIPADHCMNNSLLSSFTFDVGAFNEPVASVELDPTKHYVVLLYSDGDNAQWVQGGYREYFTWKSYNLDVPVTWTFPPMMTDFSCANTQAVLDIKGDDCLVCGPSGAGYTRMSEMYGDGIQAFSDITAASMLQNGMTTLTILDNIYENGIQEKAFLNKLEYYARYENISGALLQLDGDRYAAGKGQVWFINDKPFVSVRQSLWYPDGEGSEVPKEWIAEQASLVNAREADIHSIDGYSVINIHPWTINTENLAYFVSLLDEGVQVITGDELIAALDRYIPHENAKPAE
ncbi:MAG: hypothetical protein IJA31_11560 [Clostridia bacterium]|nr:hypothetical protein [Clostridia bacterium]